jgi:16S rRNA (adenine1518-N6/adenine1519-N6)-dimethyltransferase
MTKLGDPLSLPPLREVIAAYDLRALKSLGQNFLLDLNLTGRIARAAGDLTNSIVYEVGPGPGGLTRGLLANGAKRVVAVEQDRRCIKALAELAAAYPGRLTIIEGDALKIDEMAAIGDTGGADIRIAANLPYNIGTALLVKWLTVPHWLPWYKSMTLMFQKEVGMRIVAAPRSKAYGRLSVLSQFRCDTRIHFDIPPKAFIPPPKVTSSVVGFIPHLAPAGAPSLKALEAVTAAAFGQRRKMLRVCLKSLVSDPLTLLDRAGILPTRRAEELDMAEFCRLARTFEG